MFFKRENVFVFDCLGMKIYLIVFLLEWVVLFEFKYMEICLVDCFVWNLCLDFSCI